MEREVFLDRLNCASDKCREFAATFLIDTLPSGYVFWALLNSSYDGDLGPDEVVFPGDIEKYGDRIGPLTAEEVVSLLWRDRIVPEWIDITVFMADEQVTHFELACCVRFTEQDRILYYTWTDVAPFGVKGPAYPARLSSAAMAGEPTEKFSLAESRGDIDGTSDAAEEMDETPTKDA